MYAGKEKTSSNLAWHRPQSAISLQEEELMQTSARAVAHTTDPLEKLRLLCLSRGACGILALGRVFRRMDNNGNKNVNKEEFVKGLAETGLEISEKEAEETFDRFNIDNSGFISFDELIKQIRPPMSDSRRAVVEKVFRKFDKDGHGVITVNDIRKVYCVNSHPLYMSGEETAAKVMNRFLANFEVDGSEDGSVTLEEFMNFYSGISVSIDSDCYFDLMMRQAYKL
ncbi:unnamed protein product [Parnassius mnemosyne]|uniref:EF-hand domain-containing protein n=1 Tax=Parnassius mnemosyne TaxID=213953 RepID=A0AAV1M9X6_9NEOP